MSGLYLQPGAINSLTQFIMLLVMLLYLLSIRGKFTSTWLLIGFLAGYTTFVFHNLLFAVFIYEAWLFSLVKFHFTSFLVSLVFLLQFSYYFPRLHRKREAQLVLALSILATLSGLQFNIGSENLLPAALILIEYLWAIIVLSRQTIWLSHEQRVQEGRDKIEQKGSLLQALADLYQPQGQEAHATRAFLLIFLIHLCCELEFYLF